MVWALVGQINDAGDAGLPAPAGRTARYVTSVCNGSLLLGAAGLLQGYRSTCHWMWRHYLTQFGAEPVAARAWCVTATAFQAPGVTSGIDFALPRPPNWQGKKQRE